MSQSALPKDVVKQVVEAFQQVKSSRVVTTKRVLATDSSPWKPDTSLAACGPAAVNFATLPQEIQRINAPTSHYAVTRDAFLELMATADPLITFSDQMGMTMTEPQLRTKKGMMQYGIAYQRAALDLQEVHNNYISGGIRENDWHKLYLQCIERALTLFPLKQALLGLTFAAVDRCQWGDVALFAYDCQVLFEVPPGKEKPVGELIGAHVDALLPQGKYVEINAIMDLYRALSFRFTSSHTERRAQRQADDIQAAIDRHLAAVVASLDPEKIIIAECLDEARLRTLFNGQAYGQDMRDHVRAVILAMAAKEDMSTIDKLVGLFFDRHLRTDLPWLDIARLVRTEGGTYFTRNALYKVVEDHAQNNRWDKVGDFLQVGVKGSRFSQQERWKEIGDAWRQRKYLSQ